MLDEERCQAMQIVAQPIVTVNALFALRDLLRNQRLLAEETLSSSDKCLHGGVSIEAKQTRATLRGKCNSETPGDCAPAMPRVIKPDVPSRDRRHSQDQRGRKK